MIWQQKSQQATKAVAEVEENGGEIGDERPLDENLAASAPHRIEKQSPPFRAKSLAASAHQSAAGIRATL